MPLKQGKQYRKDSHSRVPISNDDIYQLTETVWLTDDAPLVSLFPLFLGSRTTQSSPTDLQHEGDDEEHAVLGGDMWGGHQLTPADAELDGAGFLPDPPPRQDVQYRVDREDGQQQDGVDAQVDGRVRQHHVEVAAAGDGIAQSGEGAEHGGSLWSMLST